MLSRPGKVRIKTPMDKLLSSGILIRDIYTINKQSIRDIFSNDHPIEVEIGCGKGGVLIQRARSRPDINLLGIEWLPSYAALCADRAYRHRLENIRVINADAKRVFSFLSETLIFRRIYILFPDPWPKRKHWKRRLIKLPFIKRLIPVMEIGGTIHFATDHLHYYEQVSKLFSTVSGIALVIGSHHFLSKVLIPESNYARKWLIRGKQIYTLEVVKMSCDCYA